MKEEARIYSGCEIYCNVCSGENGMVHKKFVDISDYSDLRKAVIETIQENKHLADGDNCTLKRLKDAVGMK